MQVIRIIFYSVLWFFVLSACYNQCITFLERRVYQNIRYYFLVGFLAVILIFSYSEQGFAAENKVFHVPPNKLASYVESTKGRKRVVLVWASWCPACRKKMPDYAKIETTKPGSVIAISMDQEHRYLKKYLDRSGKMPFKVIVVKRVRGEDFGTAMKSTLGIREVKSYPTMILLDENNQVVSQGHISTSKVQKFLGVPSQ